MTISLCMIVKNEEMVLGRCLDSVVKAVDEIIIIDTGSSDRTKEIAAKYTPHVFDFNWVNDFSAARNFAYAQATMDYQLWLDADDVVPPSELEKLMHLKHTLNPEVDLVTMKYHTHFDANDNPILTATRERLTKREKNYRWQDPVHECIPLSGNVLYSDIAISHKKLPTAQQVVSTRNLDIYEALEASGKPFSPRQEYYFARELKDHGRWIKAAYYFQRFLDGGKGWAEDNVAACFNLGICFEALGEEKKVLPALSRGFSYGGPRAEIYCQIGYYFKRRKEYQAALEWFRAAAGLEPPQSLGFVLQDYWGYIPNIECCVCSYRLGRYDEAREYNRRAGTIKPGDAAVQHNEQFLRKLK